MSKVAWLKDAVFYEIYPQTFYDTNGDGIGDIKGIIEKLDYIKELGANAIWLNPCFDSPFKDAGYDVRDYKKVASRYGTNEDLYRLFEEVHKRKMHLILDLVPGHTSEEHSWFVESAKDYWNTYSSRYIWTRHAFEGIGGHPYISGESERPGAYMLNFFKCQPALNYGFYRPSEPWQQSMKEEGPQKTKEAMVDVMDFWLSHGCDGFRVDMADSLVKEDGPEKEGTRQVWKDMFSVIQKKYPDAAFVSEWCNAPLSMDAGFHMDFYLDHGNNGYQSLLRDYLEHPEDDSYFKADSTHDTTRFLSEYMEWYQKTKGKSYISMFSCNHDTPRAKRTLRDREISLFFGFLLTMPGVPFIYYGDEIGMRFFEVKSKEGGYQRTGTRTPMQWNSGKNLGFSEAPMNALYLPVDPSVDAPTVESAKADQDSLYHIVKDLLALRHKEKAFQADAPMVMHTLKGKEQALVYERGNFLCIVNPSNTSLEINLPDEAYATAKLIYKIGDGLVEVLSKEKKIISARPQSFVVLKKD
jgi:maltose alpha-D-glucosyltransferase/alpha-amylase